MKTVIAPSRILHVSFCTFCVGFVGSKRELHFVPGHAVICDGRSYGASRTGGSAVLIQGHTHPPWIIGRRRQVIHLRELWNGSGLNRNKRAQRSGVVIMVGAPRMMRPDARKQARSMDNRSFAGSFADGRSVETAHTAIERRRQFFVTAAGRVPGATVFAARVL